MAIDAESDSTQQTVGAPARLVLKLQLFRALTGKQIREILSCLRFQDGPVRGQETLSGSDGSLSARELLILLRMDQLCSTLDTLERMETHYREVAKLDAAEVRRRLDATHPDDPGALALKHCLVGGADPRLPIARRLLSLIPIAMRRLEEGEQALELEEIFKLNERANQLLVAPHVQRGLNVLLAGREGGRRRNPEGKTAREELALEFREAKKADAQLTQQQFLDNRGISVSPKTLQRGLRDLKQ
jgi:hypothetical protein